MAKLAQSVLPAPGTLQFFIFGNLYLLRFAVTVFLHEFNALHGQMYPFNQAVSLEACIFQEYRSKTFWSVEGTIPGPLTPLKLHRRLTLYLFERSYKTFLPQTDYFLRHSILRF